MKNYIISALFALVLVGCYSSKTSTSAKDDMSILQDLVKNNSFEIESQWAYPQVTNALSQVGNSGLLLPGNNAGAINLIGNPNYLKVTQNEVKAALPYYGERQLVSSYNGSNIGIEFDGAPMKFKVEEGKKNSYVFSFDINDKNSSAETYSVTIQLFPNLTSIININSSHRLSIRYRGKAEMMEPESE